MKPRILFVDDEPMVLAGLKRILYPLRELWDSAFAGSGPAALEMMHQQPFDVVVSDMRMAGMNGAELLNRVMRDYPRTLRLILSGQAEEEAVLKSVGSTHQFLSKPCDSDALRSIVTRAISLDAMIEDANVKRIVNQLETLPSLPSVYHELVELLQDPEVMVDSIGAVIERDAGMTAKILKLVNSAYFGLRRPIVDAVESVSFLGVDTVKALLLTASAYSGFEHRKLGGINLDEIYRHSFEVAGLARQLAREAGEHSESIEAAFLGGMLHDIGKVILASGFSEDYEAIMQEARRQPGTLSGLEQARFNTTHAEVGAYLFAVWGLPLNVVECVGFHHRPSEVQLEAPAPLTWVHAANCLVQAPDLSSGASSDPQMDEQHLVSVGVDRESIGRAFASRTSKSNL